VKTLFSKLTLVATHTQHYKTLLKPAYFYKRSFRWLTNERQSKHLKSLIL